MLIKVSRKFALNHSLNFFLTIILVTFNKGVLQNVTKVSFLCLIIKVPYHKYTLRYCNVLQSITICVLLVKHFYEFMCSLWLEIALKST